MRYQLIDTVLERSETRLVAVKHVSAAEEYLADHFPSFPVLPGVLMLEAMLHAARELLLAAEPGAARWVLAGARGLRYSGFAAPGESLVVAVELDGEPGAASASFRGTSVVRDARGVERPAASGRFSLRPLAADLPGVR